MKYIKVLIFSLPLLTMLIWGCFEVKDEDLIKDYASTTKNKTVQIGRAGIEMPLGYYGLFRKGNNICIVKFLESGEKKQGNGNGCVLYEWYYKYSKYEWYYVEGGISNFIGNNVKHGNGKATWHDIPFLGTHGIMLNNCDIDCGELHMKRYGSRELDFITGYIFDMTKEDIEKEGFEIAPTKWKNIEEVNLKDKRLKWYKADPDREFLREIPVDELW